MPHIASPLGSTWRRWDLHVHTPESLVHNFGGTNPWDRYLEELAHLPPDLSVIGVNDYLFVDGYKSVLAEFQSGRLPNLEAIFPVIELRLNQFAGSEGEFRRVNYHVIFEMGFDADTISAQFINGLSAHYKLADGVASTWEGFPTRENLAVLGARIRATTPDEKKSSLESSDLQLGFSNLVVGIDHVDALLKNSVFAGKTLTAIGKAEWESMRWSGGGIASKKDLINRADVVFTAAESPSAYDRARTSLTKQGVNDRLLDCSDAHTWSDSDDKDRLGNCSTWISAQPTLEGLKHAITEFEHRVFVGTVPSKINSVRLRPADHIRKVSITKSPKAAASAKALFDTTLELNPGFVAVLGNKGKGKSALLDAIGLAGDCTTEKHFTFLKSDRFRNPTENRAAEHEVTLEWADGVSSTRRLDEHVSATSPPRLTYLPQLLLDEICSADPGEPSALFSRQLNEVLFAHVSIADRLAQSNLDSLIDTRVAANDGRIVALRGDLTNVNRRITELERRMHPAKRQALEESLAQLLQRLETLLASEPTVPAAQADGSDPDLLARIAALRVSEGELDTEILLRKSEDAELALDIDAGLQLRVEAETLQGQWDQFLESNTLRLERLSISSENLATFTLDLSELDSLLVSRRERREAITEDLSIDVAGSVGQRRATVIEELRTAKEQLDRPSRERAEAEAAHERWVQACEEIRSGTAEVPGIAIREGELSDLDTASARMDELKLERMAVTLGIHAALLAKIAIYEDLYQPARAFIAGHPLAEQGRLAFGASLRERRLEARLFEIVGRNAAGTFAGVAEGAAQLQQRLERVVLTDPDSVKTFLTELDEALHEDRRRDTAVPVEIERCLRTGYELEELYDLIFGLAYLEPHYSLRYKDLELDQLSPGEKGTLLLMFYLLVDPSRSPLLLDQPDENLDNQTIKDLLVPAIKEASARRQVIVVTHNPNVAIVADADQLIVADKGDDGFFYESGAIEDAILNKDAVDVLEGTWPAFRNRQHKYQQPPD